MPNEDGCMLWLKPLNSCGYGTFTFNGKSTSAHRLSLIISAGLSLNGMDSAHSCRNKHCVAPNHLSWKTRAENQADRHRDETVPSKERNGAAKLTLNQVVEIRQRYKNGEGSYTTLAKQYGVHFSMIGRIVNNQNWT